MKKVIHNPENVKLSCGISFGGKSRTGQKIIDEKYSHENDTSSYNGFFPVDSPKIVVTFPSQNYLDYPIHFCLKYLSGYLDQKKILYNCFSKNKYY